MAVIWSKTPLHLAPREATSEKFYPVRDLELSTWDPSEGTDLFACTNDDLFFNDGKFIISPACDGTLELELRQESIVIASTTLYREAGVDTYTITVSEDARKFITNWSALAVWATVNGSDTVKLGLGITKTPGPGPLSLRVRVDMSL